MCWRFRTLIPLFVLAIVVTGVLLHAGLGRAAEPGKANVGFGAAVGDDEILEFLKRHGTTPVAAFMWASGLTGTHRVYTATTTEAFLQQTRAKAIESFDEGITANPIRLRRFIDQHTESEVVASERLQTEARSLLTIRENLSMALAAAKGNTPLIYALEMSGDKADLERLRTDRLVKAFELSTVVDGKVITQHTPKPEPYQRENVHPQIQGMDPRELYQRVKVLAAAANQGRSAEDGR